MRLVTWNVNSLNARLERALEWFELMQPDVVCLQETKLAAEEFPHAEFAELGYESAHHGQGQWNGVAIVSRVGLDDVHNDFGDGADPDVDARIIWATCGGVRVASCYVPNGRSLDDDHYQYKLAWLDRLQNDLEANLSASDDICVVGDFNIAPDDRDVWDPKGLVGVTHTSQSERDKLATLKAWGLEDVFREHHDEAGLYSWWDYRDGNFHKRKGMRIDLIMSSASVRAATERVFVDRNARKGKLPSDHAPVVADITR
ncbi:MAG: exodeoxyribonuclease III [Acidimicrobiales bacterium]|nr:exodeoxyribonuclease III [Acidimicrobiales bacterium]RZV42743.1 MAG: exodeoxyribonuclease III [Acidimicrobiales bacterium]